jgi:hypothetical protein
MLIWEQWYNELEKLASDAAEWDSDNVELFLQTVDLMAQGKRRDREEGRKKLQEAISALCQKREETLRLNLIGCDDWSAEHCPLSEAASLLERVGAFDALLQRHQELYVPVLLPKNERDALYELLKPLELEILEAHASLSSQLSHLAHVPAPDNTQPATEDVTQPPDEDVTTVTAASPVVELPLVPDEEGLPVSVDSSVPLGKESPTAEAQDAGTPEQDYVELQDATPHATAIDGLPDATAHATVTPAGTGGVIEHQAEVAQVQMPPTEVLSSTPPLPVEPEPQPESKPAQEFKPQPAPAPPPSTSGNGNMSGNINRGFAANAVARATAKPVPKINLKPVPKINLSLDTLHPPQLLAQYLLTHDRPEGWNLFLLSLIATGDLSAAYWLARTLEADGMTPPVPEWLLAATQGARWIRSDADPLALDLLKIALEHPIDQSADDIQKILGLSAGLLPALIAPNCGLDSWLQIPKCCPSAEPLIEAINNFAAFGIGLCHDDVTFVSGLEQNEAAVIKTARELKDWLDEAPNRWVKGVGAVWNYLVKPNSAFAKALQPAADDQRDSIAQVREAMADWQDHTFFLHQINAANLATSKGAGKAKTLGATLCNSVERDLLSVCDGTLRWCDLVERQHALRKMYNERAESWQAEMVETLRTEISPALSSIEAELSAADKSPRMHAAVFCLRQSLAKLREMLQIEPPAIEDGLDSAFTPITFTEGANDLQTSLGRRLWLVPEVPQEDVGFPTSLQPIPQALRDSYAEGRTIRTAFDQWLDLNDYRFADGLAEAIPDEELRRDLSIRYTDSLLEARQNLHAELHATVDAIEQAVLDGTISDERAQFLSITESIKPDETFNFAPEMDKLQEVRTGLASALESQLQRLRDQWGKVASLMQTHAGLPAETREQMRAFIQSALDNGDVRVVDECLARVKVIVETKEFAEDLTLEKLGWVAPATERDMLQDFLEAAPNIDEWLHHNSSLSADRLETAPDEILQGNAPFGVPAPKPQNREKIARAVRAWLTLKHKFAQTPKDDAAKQIGHVLQLLGFELVNHAGMPPVRIIDSKGDWTHARAVLNSGGQAKPIPQFAVLPNLDGQKVEGNYDVICVWRKPSAAKLQSILSGLQLGARSVIILYFGALTQTERYSMAGMTREKKDLAIVLVDETLLLFVTGEEDPLPVFLRCALPFSTVIPYTPQLHGDVPKEMFFGREDMMEKLWKREDSCIVYGGRQLGKTAMLRNLMRREHSPKHQQYVWFASMDLEFGPHVGKGTDNLWRLLREWFKKDSLLSPRVSTDTPAQIVTYILDAMNAAPDARVLAIFDEADDFLDADAAENFPVVKELRELMLNTDRRFKVVFAGNRKVLRFQGIPNQPLAHFGEPILIGPLEPGPAQQLVREPFEALGFKFSDESLVLRILSHTSYHAGLIQFFCHALLKRVYERTGNSVPPHIIYPSDVEAVYRNRETRDAISDRFNLTLKLKTEYGVIASIIIADQMATKDGYDRSYSAADLLDMARERWPQGFAETGVEDMKVQLDEMCGLGVLVRDVEGYFRLRSPNLVGMMGTREDIGKRLAELAETVPETKYDVDSHHTWLDAVPGRYSPLTYAQERTLNKHRTGVGLVLASEALGAEALPEVFARFIPPDLPESNLNVCVEIPPEVNTAAAIKSWLNDFLATNEGGAQSTDFRRYVIYQRTIPTASEIHAYISEAADFCRDHPKVSRVLRVIFLLDPAATWQWLSVPQESRKALEDRLDIVASPRLWNKTGVHQRLSQLNMLYSDDVCQQVLQATGGWPLLLDEIFAQCGVNTNQEDPRQCIPAFVQRLESPEGDLCRRFRDALGIEEGTAAWKVLRFIEEEQISSMEDILPEFVSLDENECSQAVEYLQRMSCLDVTYPSVQIEPTVRRVLFSS